MKVLLPTLLLFLVGATTASGHSTHTQVTEVEWNQETGRFEVAMKLDAAALEDSVSRGRGSRFRLESAEPADAILEKWLPHFFRIDMAGSSQPGTIRWAGHELELHTVWLYFEYVPATADSADRSALSFTADRRQIRVAGNIRVENRCLLDVRPETIHFVVLRHGKTIHQGHCSFQQSRTDFTASRNLRPQNSLLNEID